jgi:hypothetical protein
MTPTRRIPARSSGIPAKAGIQLAPEGATKSWTPAYAGVTPVGGHDKGFATASKRHVPRFRTSRQGVQKITQLSPRS